MFEQAQEFPKFPNGVLTVRQAIEQHIADCDLRIKEKQEDVEKLKRAHQWLELWQNRKAEWERMGQSIALNGVKAALHLV